jgi:uncharacterized protein (DUF1778 family)
MGRYARTDTAERRTEFIGLWVTPTQRVELDTAAEQHQTTRSDFARDLLFRRVADVIAGTRRNPEAAAIKKALHDLGNGLSANGNLLNQIARHLNSTGELRDTDPALLHLALERHIEAAEQVKLAIARVLDQ